MEIKKCQGLAIVLLFFVANVSATNYGYNYEINHTDTYSKIKIYSEPVYLDKIVKLEYDSNDDLILEWKNYKLKIMLKVKEKNKDKIDLKEYKTKTDLQFTKNKVYLNNSYKFDWKFKDNTGKSLNIDTFYLELENLTAMSFYYSNNTFYLPDGLILDLNDLAQNFTLINDKNFVTISEVGSKKVFDSSEIFLDPTINYTSSKDSYIRQAFQSTNYGTETTAIFNDGSTHKALIDFDMSSLIENSSIDTANLFLYFSTTSSLKVKTAYPITSNWSETEVTWTNRTVSDLWTDAGLGTSDYNSTYFSSWAGGSGWESFDVQPALNQSVNKKLNMFGWLLTSSDSTTHTFRTKEYTGTTSDPYIEITYTHPGPNTTLTPSPVSSGTSFVTNRTLNLICNSTMNGINGYSNISYMNIQYYHNTEVGNTDVLEHTYPVNSTTENLSWSTTLSSDGNYRYSCEVGVTFQDGSTNYFTYPSYTANFSVDSIAPNVTVYTPTGFYNYNTSIPLRFNVTDPHLANCSYSLNAGTTNITIACTNTTFNTSEGNHTLYFYVNDTANNKNYTTKNFTVDLTAPNITINLTNLSNYSTNIVLNYTVQDLYLNNCWYSVNNGLTNKSISCSLNISNETWAEGLNNVTIYANDSAGNINSSKITFRLDTTGPTVTILFPEDVSEINYNESVSLNYTVSDVTGVSACWYSIDSGTNVTLASCNNATFNVSEGSHNVRVYANDTLNNLGSKTHSFTVVLLGAAITLNQPKNNTYWNNGTNFYFNYTATAAAGLSVCELWGNWTGSFSKNYTWLNPTNATMNYTQVNVTEGVFNWNVWCNDTANVGRFSNDNLTFIIDQTYPTASITSFNTTAGSVTISFALTANDLNLNNTCHYTIFNSSGQIDLVNGLPLNNNFSCSTPQTVQVSKYGTYNLTINVSDYALNKIQLNQTFTVSAAGGGGGGGGGGSVTTIVINKTSCGDGICQRDGNDAGLKEDFYTCPVDCEGVNIDSAIFSCIDNDPATSCVWEDLTYQYVALSVGVLLLILTLSTVKNEKGKQVPLAKYYYAKSFKSKKFRFR